MSVTINKTDGTVLTTIQDGAADTVSTNLALIGRLYKNYGELVNENFVKLLENFASSSSPSASIEGQIWYDKSERTIKIYRTTGFVAIARITTSSAEPSNARTGDQWWDTTDEQLKLFNGVSWIVIAPGYTASMTKTGAFAEIINDNTSAPRIVVRIYQQNQTVAFINREAAFIPQTAITGFTTIGRGITLSSLADTKFNGTATNADAVDGISSEQFLRSDSNDTTSGTLGVLNDSGLTIGEDSDLTLSIDTSLAKIVKNNPGNLQIMMESDIALEITDDQRVQFSDGTVDNPSITFINDTNTGIYRISADQLGIATNGAVRLSVNTSETNVIQDLNVGGNIDVSGDSLLSGDATVLGDLEINGMTTLGANSGDSVVINASSISIPNDIAITGGDVGMTGALTVGGVVNIVDNANITGNLTVNGDTISNGSTVANGTFSCTVTDANDFVIDSLGRVRVNSSSSATGYAKEGDITLATNGVIHARNTAKYACTFIGTLAGLAVAASHHVATVTRTTTGTYSLTLADIFNTPVPMPSSFPSVVGSVNGNGYFYLNGNVSAGQTSINVITANAAGTPTDFSRVMFAIYDGPYT